MKVARRAGGVAALAACVSALADCRDPTEMTIALRTDVPCASWQNASITAASASDVETSAPQATTNVCDASGNLGTLTIVPSGSKSDAIVVKVVGGDGRSPETCNASDTRGCIVARRSLRFVPHTPLRLTITLARACGGVLCAADETCAPATGQCVNYAVDPARCEGAGCDDSALAPGDGGVRDDGGADAQGPAIDGGAPDAPDGGGAGSGTPCDASAQCNLGAGLCCCPSSATPACELRRSCSTEFTCLP